LGDSVKKEKVTNVLIVGVGGQGILLASEILANVALAAGYDVKQSEVHGMAQRGGSVSSHVRFGPQVHSPTIDMGQADILLSFELLEAVRWLDYVAPRGQIIVNLQKVIPMPVASGKMRYGDDNEEKLRRHCGIVYSIDAHALALKAGHLKTANLALLGVLNRLLDFPNELWEAVISKRVPAKTLATNLTAFHLGSAEV
jgi:indolepyruvate ferredoxin oxidoreductase beta subunit